MKKRISLTVDPDTYKFLHELIKEGRYRNRSHAIEDIIKLKWEEKHAKSKK